MKVALIYKFEEYPPLLLFPKILKRDKENK